VAPVRPVIVASRPSKRTPAPLMPAADSAACARSVSVPSICGADQSSVSPASTAGTTTAAAISGSHGGRMERSRPVGPVPLAAARSSQRQLPRKSSHPAGIGGFGRAGTPR
jgi:hypothetical protein